MTKVTINPTPTEQVVAKAQAEVTVKDAKGRTITLKRPGVLAQYRLIEMLNDSAKNEVYMSMVLPLIYISAIDGEVSYQPASKRELEALITQLDEDGVNAVVSGVMEHFGKSDPEADKANIKK